MDFTSDTKIATKLINSSGGVYWGPIEGLNVGFSLQAWELHLSLTLSIAVVE